jgi:hypothetical protein
MRQTTAVDPRPAQQGVAAEGATTHPFRIDLPNEAVDDLPGG